MELGPLIIILLRLLIPFTILRWPLVGGIICMLLDGGDVVLIDVINKGDFSHYHLLDKYLDMYYLSFEVYVSWKWTNLLARRTSIILFIYRLVGFVLFEVTQVRLFLFIFPNLFENFFLFFVAYKSFLKRETLNLKQLVVILLILLIPKMFQEYVLHFKQAQPWNWFKTNIWWYN